MIIYCPLCGNHHAASQPCDVIIPTSDANDLDDVVRELGIEASETTPAEAVRELKAESDRLRAELAAKDERRVIETKKWVIAETELAEAKARIAHWENLGAGTSDAYTPDLGPEEKIVWILSDMMNAVENHFGVENAKRLGHIHCCADRLLREVIDPKDARIAALEAAGNRLGDAAVDGVLTSIEAVTELRAELSQTKRDLKDWQDSSEAYRHDAEKAEAHIKELNNKWADDVLRVDRAEAERDAMREARWWMSWDSAPKDGRWIVAVCNDMVSLLRVSWGNNREGHLAWCSNTSSYGDGDGLFAGWIDCPTKVFGARAALSPSPDGREG